MALIDEVYYFTDTGRKYRLQLIMRTGVTVTTWMLSELNGRGEYLELTRWIDSTGAVAAATVFSTCLTQAAGTEYYHVGGIDWRVSIYQRTGTTTTQWIASRLEGGRWVEIARWQTSSGTDDADDAAAALLGVS